MGGTEAVPRLKPRLPRLPPIPPPRPTPPLPRIGKAASSPPPPAAAALAAAASPVAPGVVVEEEVEEETAMRGMGDWRVLRKSALKIAPERRGSLRRLGCCCCCWRVLPPSACAVDGGGSGVGGIGGFIASPSPVVGREGGREGRCVGCRGVCVCDRRQSLSHHRLAPVKERNERLRLPLPLQGCSTCQRPFAHSESMRACAPWRCTGGCNKWHTNRSSCCTSLP